MIYFLQCHGPGSPIKIGYSGKVERRISNFSSPYAMVVLGVCEGDKQIEQELHAKFSAARITGEWFKPSRALLAFIKSHTTPLRPTLRRRVRRPRLHPMPPHICKVVDAAGGNAKLAEGLGVSPSAVSQWERIPAERVIAVEKITGISRRRLRPDLYPPEPA